MKLTFVALMLFALASCSNQKPLAEGCYKGRLEIKAICLNYTISLVEGRLPDNSIEAEWTDETTGKKYSNVFSLVNPCVLPASINEGDEFYFILTTEKSDDCVTCMAYYPKPAKALNIKILNQPCPQ